MTTSVTDKEKTSGPPGPIDNRREHTRMNDPALVVKVDGKTYKTVNWSMGGLLIEGYKGVLTTGALVTVSALGESVKNLTDVCIRARVIRSDQEMEYIAVNFLGLDQSAFGLLRTFTDIKSNARQPY